jgi:hypothetical protein
MGAWNGKSTITSALFARLLGARQPGGGVGGVA